MKELWTDLNDRRLRYDGVSVVQSEKVFDLLMRGVAPPHIRVLDDSDDIIQYNEQCNEAEQIRTNNPEPISFSLRWQLPEDLLNLDLHAYIFKAFENKNLSHYTSAQVDAAMNRVILELNEFERRGLTDVLRTIIYVIQVFKDNNQIWGVGRGSSCASYILFLIGLHEVDPIQWGIDLEEFLHD